MRQRFVARPAERRQDNRIADTLHQRQRLEPLNCTGGQALRGHHGKGDAAQSDFFVEA